jgi:hypothetical protein
MIFKDFVKLVLFIQRSNWTEALLSMRSLHHAICSWSSSTGQTMLFFCFPCNLGYRSYPQSDGPHQNFMSSISLLSLYLRLRLLNIVLPFRLPAKIYCVLIVFCKKEVSLPHPTCTVHLVLFSLLSWSIRFRSSCCLCVCAFPPLTFECLNQSKWNLVCITWHLIPYQRRTS